MGPLKKRIWVFSLILAVASCLVWFRYGYRQLTFVELAVDRAQALRIARQYLGGRSVSLAPYRTAVVFEIDDWADRYLQKTLGIDGQSAFLKSHAYELFSWKVRFFKELQKEEFVVEISPRTGQVISFNHTIEDIEKRAALPQEEAKRCAEAFLRDQLRIPLEQYEFHQEKSSRFDNRLDYSFSWEKKGVYIPWQKDEGGAKLLVGATVSGEEIRVFYGNVLDIPEKFHRYVQKQLVFGEYLFSFYNLLFMVMFVWSVYLVDKRKAHVATVLAKRFFIIVGGFWLILNLLSVANNWEEIAYSYPTSVSLSSFAFIQLFKLLVTLLTISVTFIVPGIAAEGLYAELKPPRPYRSFLYFLQRSFWTRAVARGVVFGYLLFGIKIGLQAGIFAFGQKYLGVWREWFSFTRYSSTYLPAFSALVLAFSASISEETFFRLFGIAWARKYARNTFLAVVLTAVLWGFGHSTYAIFPVWFRGVEVSLIGLGYGFIFLRYGIVPVLVAHYLFDVFWGAAAHLLGRSTPGLFAGALAVFLLPLGCALVAFLRNRSETERPIAVAFSPTQRYNSDILAAYCLKRRQEGASAAQLRPELLRHNWDSALVDAAFRVAFPDEGNGL